MYDTCIVHELMRVGYVYYALAHLYTCTLVYPYTCMPVYLHACIPVSPCTCIPVRVHLYTCINDTADLRNHRFEAPKVVSRALLAASWTPFGALLKPSWPSFGACLLLGASGHESRARCASKNRFWAILTALPKTHKKKQR